MYLSNNNENLTSINNRAKNIDQLLILLFEQKLLFGINS